MEKRNNKKLFAIIGGSVLAFVLTIALSVSITLAYFGDTTDGSYTVKMDKAVTLQQLATDAVVLNEHALPGEGVDVDLTATLTSTPTEGAFVAMKVTLTSAAGTGTGATAATVPTITLDSGEGVTGNTWTKVGNVYYYTTAVGAGGTAQLAPVTTAATLQGRFIIDPELTNTAAESTITITVEIVAVQGVLFDDQGVVDTTPTITEAQKMFEDYMTA